MSGRPEAQHARRRPRVRDPLIPLLVLLALIAGYAAVVVEAVVLR